MEPGPVADLATALVQVQARDVLVIETAMWINQVRSQDWLSTEMVFEPFDKPDACGGRYIEVSNNSYSTITKCSYENVICAQGTGELGGSRRVISQIKDHDIRVHREHLFYPAQSGDLCP